MAKQRHKVARYSVSVNAPQQDILEKLMKEDSQTDVSAYFGFLIVQENKRREEEKNKRGPGRPRKEEDGGIDSEPEPDYSDDLPKKHFYFGEWMGPRQKKDIEERQSVLPDVIKG